MRRLAEESGIAFDRQEKVAIIRMHQTHRAQSHLDHDEAKFERQGQTYPVAEERRRAAQHGEKRVIDCRKQGRNRHDADDGLCGLLIIGLKVLDEFEGEQRQRESNGHGYRARSLQEQDERRQQHVERYAVESGKRRSDGRRQQDGREIEREKRLALPRSNELACWN